jgi:hypothetical protein
LELRQRRKVFVRKPDIITPPLGAIIVYLVREDTFYGGLIHPPHHGEGQKCLRLFLPEYGLERRDFVLQEVFKQEIKAEGFNIDIGNGQRRLPE